MAQTAYPSYPDQGDVKDYVALLKPRVMVLVVFTGVAGVCLAPGHIHPVLAFVSVLCIALASGAAGAINMWYDRDIDAVMERTRKRPLPSGKIEPAEALSFGIILALGAVILMYLATNIVAATLLSGAVLFYVFIYTIWLKRRTSQNIVVGGAAGSFPPVIGWAAVTGDISVEAIVLFLIIFFWTPPHFWVLALYRARDYELAEVPMLPVVRGERATKHQILIYTAVLVPLSGLPCLLGFSGLLIYGASALILGVIILHLAFVVLKDETYRGAKRMFKFSIFYLFSLFAMLIMDNMLLLG